jgi:hypothetical protein
MLPETGVYQSPEVTIFGEEDALIRQRDERNLLI